MDGMTYMCLEVACPLASVSARIGRHMVSFATLMKLYSKSFSYKDNNKKFGIILTRKQSRPMIASCLAPH
jgi:hypothetical protein